MPDSCRPRHNRRVNVRWIDPGDPIGAKRGEIVVCIPVYGAHDQFVECLASVLAHTPPTAPVLVCDDASPDPRSYEHVAALAGETASEREIVYARRERNVGFPANVNGGFEAAAPADVVILNSDCRVAAGWLEGLRDAAYSDSTIATATALANHGSVVSVPEAGLALTEPRSPGFDQAAAAVRTRSLRLRPRLITAIGHCVYVRRDALELVGGFDLAFSPGYGEEVDFSQRCLHAGLSHVAADDVLVLHHGGASLAANGTPNPLQHEHELTIAERYPYYHAAVREFESDPATPLAWALSRARRAIDRVSVAIDVRGSAGPPPQDNAYVRALVRGLAGTGRARLTVFVAPGETEDLARVFGDLPETELVAAVPDGGSHLPRPADVVHRLYPLSEAGDLAALTRMGDRLLVTSPDLVSYLNPSYFRDFHDWERYRVLIRRLLAAADRVIFHSAHTRNEALAEHLIEPERGSVARPRIDPHARPDRPTPPVSAASLGPEPQLILCLGTDARHENRIFALRLLAVLRRDHDWTGFVVLAGPRTELGSSRADEHRFLGQHPELGEAVLDVGAVSEAERAWLIERAALVLYPTVSEGDVAAPFEAAERGVPCLWAPGTSLSELLPEDAAGIVRWTRPPAPAARSS